MVTQLRHGAFVAPFHDIRESPTLALRQDLELASWLDQLGYQEIWYGEHHSLGWEIISSPELMIAAAIEMTKRIKVGSGVISLSYHHPLNVANRIVQLDHMSMGRVMFGFGPGMLPTDAAMMGIDTTKQREMMAESLDAIVRLVRGETVTKETDWFTLKDARVHLGPYSKPSPELAVASVITPSGGMAAGKYGIGMLCVAATQNGSFMKLGENWRIAQEIAADCGNTMDPSSLRLAGPMHIAETREKARENVRHGLQKWLTYMDYVRPPGAKPIIVEGADAVDSLIESAYAVIGTPDDAIAQIERLQDAQGAFGSFLHLAHDWANWENTKQSYELYARHVIPHFNRSNDIRIASYEQLTRESEAMMSQRHAGNTAAFEKWEAKKKEIAQHAEEGAGS
jgi:limonene 1,2-monooxygenase